MAGCQHEIESFDRRFGQLLDEALSNPPEESSTREELVAAREKLALCLEKGLSRRFLHTQFRRAGGAVSYQRFCVLLKEVVKDMELVRRIKEREINGGERRKAKSVGSPLVDARRRGKTLSEIRSEATAALAQVANLVNDG